MIAKSGIYFFTFGNFLSIYIKFLLNFIPLRSLFLLSVESNDFFESDFLIVAQF